MIHKSTSPFAYTDLLSQLEESKFLRLFRYLADAATGTPATGPFPLALEQAELQVMTIAGDRWTTAQNFFFQLEHLPIACWHAANIESLLTGALTAAFTCLKRKPELLDVLAAKAMARPTPESGWPTHWSGIDSYYFFVTNICDPALLGGDGDRYTEIAHGLYESILGISRDSHPRFGLGNPETFCERTPNQVEQFMVDLINSPSSYYLIAREGYISVTPVTEHGQYATGEKSQPKSPGSRNAVTVTSALRAPHLCSEKLAQFEELLNSRGTKEKDIQQFLRTTPEILFSLDDRYCELRPHVCLYDSTGKRLIPDFMVCLEPERTWDIFELKMPYDAITVQSQDSESPSAQAARGIAELLRYRDVLSTRASRKSLAKKMGTAPYEPCLVMVIGRGNPQQRHTWQGRIAGLPSVDIVSYDYLFQRAADCQTILKRQTLAAQ